MSGRTTLSAGGLRIEFFRDGDRYRHEIVECGGELLRPLLASIEGAADDEWPASPPLQELHVEQRGADSEVALLVGRAGRSHWSLSVEVDGSQQSLLFDVACRSPAAGDRLGSSYRLAMGEFPAAWHGDAPIALWSSFGLQILEGEVQAEASDKHAWRIVPRATSTGNAKIQTFRWQYRIGPTARSTEFIPFPVENSS